MKVTLFTSNKSRHNFLINLLSQLCDNLFVVQECETLFPGILSSRYSVNNTTRDYFNNVNEAQNEIFGNPFINEFNKNIKIITMRMGDLNHCSLNLLEPFLNSDYYIIFGSSFIKGELIEFLIKKKAINIHMGISPYYRGNDCNFWALYDNNPHLVGSTIHYISKGLDSGPILYHALSKKNKNYFIYTMSAVQSAFYSIVEKLKSNLLHSIESEPQDLSKQIRYTKNEFNEDSIKIFNSKKINIKDLKFDHTLLKDPYFLN